MKGPSPANVGGNADQTLAFPLIDTDQLVIHLDAEKHGGAGLILKAGHGVGRGLSQRERRKDDAAQLKKPHSQAIPFGGGILMQIIS
jgi:hypothetical protein